MSRLKVSPMVFFQTKLTGVDSVKILLPSTLQLVVAPGTSSKLNEPAGAQPYIVK